MTVRSVPAGTRPLDAVAYAGMFVFGIVMALFGAVMPILVDRLALRLEDVGLVFVVMNGAMLAASFVVGPAMDRFGIKPALAIGAALVGCALVGVAVAARLPGLLAAAAVLGVGGGALNAATNTLVADLHEAPAEKAAALNVLGVFFGFGALLLPAGVGALLSLVGLPVLLGATAALCGLAGAAAAFPAFPAAKQAHGLPLDDMRRLLGVPVVLALACLLFFQSGNEFVLGGYFSTFATRELGLTVERASFLLAAYWAALMVSRATLGRLVPRLGAHRVVIAGALLAGAGMLAIGAAHGTAVAAPAIVLVGMAVAGIFPTVLGIAAAAFPAHSGTVFGLLFTVALTGGMSMPWVAGLLARASGLRAVFVLGAAGFLAIALLAALARRLGEHPHEQALSVFGASG